MIGKVLFFTAKVVTKGSFNIAKGFVGTVKTGKQILTSSLSGDIPQTKRLVSSRLQGAIAGIEQTADEIYELIECATDSRKNFFSSENADRLASLVPLGIVALGFSFGVDDLLQDESTFTSALALPIETNDGLVPNLDHSTLSIQDGIFVGNSDQLNQLTQAGLIDGTEHLSSDSIERSYAAREAFLTQYGYNELPEGYEVHHIIPLSEGGADVPGNMVLVSEADHAYITSMQSAFYRW